MFREGHGIFFGVIASIAVTFMAIFVKLAVSVPNETIVFFRFLIPLFLLYIFGDKKKLHFNIKKVPKHLVRGLAGLAAIYCYFYALKVLPLVTAVTLASTMPLFVPFVVLFWHKLLVSKQRFFAAGIGFLGVLVILRPTEGFFEWASLFALASGLLGAIALVGLRNLSKSELSETILLYYFIISAAVSFFPMIYGWEPIESKELWYILFGAAVAGFIYQFFLTLAYKHAPATKASIPSFLSVVFSGFAEWLIWGQIPSLWALVGVLLIIIAGVISLSDQTPPKQLKKLF